LNLPCALACNGESSVAAVKVAKVSAVTTLDIVDFFILFLRFNMCLLSYVAKALLAANNIYAHTMPLYLI
jgi:hypothetical protein